MARDTFFDVQDIEATKKNLLWTTLQQDAQQSLFGKMTKVNHVDSIESLADICKKTTSQVVDRDQFALISLQELARLIDGQARNNHCELQLDSIKRTASRQCKKGKSVTAKFTPKEFEILNLLIHSTVKVDKNYIYKNVWNNECVVKKTLDVHLFSLRQKLETLNYEVLWDGEGYILKLDNSEMK